MTSSNDDRTVAYTEMPKHGGSGASGMIEVPKARLVCADPSQVDGPLPGGGVIHLTAGSEQTVGRGETCTYPIPSKKLSRQHARVFPGVGAWGIEDLNSTNGIKVNELKVKTAWLKHGDEVRFGPICFRFELDQPASAAAVAAAFAVADGGDDEDSNRTMMVGGLGAGKAIIEAARKAEAAASEAVAPPPPRVQATAHVAAKQGNSGRWLAMGAGALVIGAMIAGGVVYYPIYKLKQETERLVSSVNRDIIQILQRADAVAQGDDSKQREQNEKEIQLLAPRLEEIWKQLVSHPELAELANLYARARFLSFERMFKNRLTEGQFDAARKEAKAFKQVLEEIARKLPAGGAAAETEALTTAVGLADLAGIVADYRAFVRQFSQIDKDPKPTLAKIDEVDRRRADFHALRKAKVLEVDYLKLRDAVMDCDGHDLPLIDRWRATVKAGQP
ncbi:putative Signal peptide protein [uncultured Gammaproteobacteria bacterium]